MNTNAHEEKRFPRRGLTIWNLIVLSALAAFVGLTWWTQPPEIWSLQAALEAQDGPIAPDRITLFGGTQQVTLTLNTHNATNDQENMKALHMTSGSALTGFYNHAQELGLPEEGDIELRFAYSTGAAGKLMLDWLPTDKMQDPPGAQTHYANFGDEVRGYITTSHLGPFPAQALQNHGLRVLLASPQPVSYMEMILFETSALSAWKRTQ